MLGVVDIEYIRKKHNLEGWSIRKMARQCLVSRQVVRKALKSAEPWRYTRKADKPCPVMDPYRDVITQWIRDDEKAPRKQRHTASRIYLSFVSLPGLFCGVVWSHCSVSPLLLWAR